MRAADREATNMAVRVGNSYVSDAAYSYAASKANEAGESAKSGKSSGVMKELAERFPNLKFSVGTAPFSGAGTNNVSISPKILKQIEQDPEKRMEYEALIYDIAQWEPPGNQPGRKLKSHGFIIGDDGGLRSWGISTGDDGTRPSQSSAKRSDKKNWWQDMLDAPKKKKKPSPMQAMQEKAKERAAQQIEIEEAQSIRHSEALRKEQAAEAEQILRANAEKIVNLPHQGNPALAKAYLQGTKAMGKSPLVASTEELSKFLQEHFSVVQGGMASISGKHLRECLTDDEKRLKLLDNLRTADEMLERRKGEIGFQSMKVTIDEDGEMTVESSKSTVTINEEKSRRQIAAAATKGDMQAVMARLQQDLQEVEAGLKRNMCDEAEVEKAKKLIEQAKQRMAKLPDRAPTPEEQSRMAVNMLI